MTRFLILLLSITAKACIFKHVEYEPESHITQFLPLYERTLIRNPSAHSCECGADYHTDNVHEPKVNDNATAIKDGKAHRNQTWILYIRVELANAEKRLCVGTIVNSNMVITSHRCLQRWESISVSDVFRSKQGNSSSFSSAGDITLSSELDLSSPTNQIFPVKKVIYSERFAYDQTYEQVPESDVAILVVDFDFTKSKTKNSPSPICVPKYGEISTKEIINREGHYQGIRSWEGTDTYFNLGVHNYSRIGTAEDCNEHGGLGVKPKNNETLCLVFTSPGPTIEGGPLGFVVKRYIEGGPRRSFLLGMANWVEKSPTNAAYNYAYFENINSIVTYIEHQSSLHDSSWCPTPHPDDQIWPWEFLTEPYVYDKSLDCECGRQDLGARGRIIGGKNASVGEFPWLVKLTIARNTVIENGETVAGYFELCGGSVINDLMILTAASCFVSEKKLEHTDSFNVDYTPSQVNLTEIFIRSYFLYPEEQNLSDTRVYAKKIVYHPGYVDEHREFRVDFDMALIILNDSLTLGKATKEHGRIDPVCLPHKKHYLDDIVGQLVTVVGWGSTNYTGDDEDLSDVLKKLDVPVLPLAYCLNNDFLFFSRAHHFPTDTRFCANIVDDGNKTGLNIQNPGASDTGGPVMHRAPELNGRHVQVGIFSYYNLDLTKNKTSTYYTNVQAFLPYIYYYANEYGARFCKGKG